MTPEDEEFERIEREAKQKTLAEPQEKYQYGTPLLDAMRGKANEALDKKAENAGELGLDYEPAQQEPVGAECKFDREQKWVRCEIAHHNLVQSEPHKWPGYQTRLLYTSPQPAPVQQEPVAWMYEDMMGLVGVRVQKEKPIVARPVTPLYTSPQPAQQEPVAGLLVGQDSDGRYVSIAAKAHADTLPLGEYKLFTSPPAQRTWVGLTDDQRTNAIWTDGGFGAGALWAEKQLEEKNT